MKTFAAAAVILALSVSGVLAGDGQKMANLCLSPDAPKHSVDPKTKVANVLCCCNTMNGMCCKYQSFCGGFVMGCICN